LREKATGRGGGDRFKSEGAERAELPSVAVPGGGAESVGITRIQSGRECKETPKLDIYFLHGVDIISR